MCIMGRNTIKFPYGGIFPPYGNFIVNLVGIVGHCENFIDTLEYDKVPTLITSTIWVLYRIPPYPISPKILPPEKVPTSITKVPISITKVPISITKVPISITKVPISITKFPYLSPKISPESSHNGYRYGNFIKFF